MSRQEKKMLEKSTNQLAELKNQSIISLNDLMNAFEQQLRKDFSPKGVFPAFAMFNLGPTTEEGAFKYVVDMARDVLNQLLDDKESLQALLSTKASSADYIDRIIKRTQEENTQALHFDRSLFRDLVGNHVKKGHGGRIPKTINLSALVPLMIEYNNGFWKEKEEKAVNYELLDSASLDRMVRALNKFKENEAFKSTLEKFCHPSNQKELAEIYWSHK